MALAAGHALSRCRATQSPGKSDSPPVENVSVLSAACGQRLAILPPARHTSRPRSGRAAIQSRTCAADSGTPREADLRVGRDRPGARRDHRTAARARRRLLHREGPRLPQRQGVVRLGRVLPGRAAARLGGHPRVRARARRSHADAAADRGRLRELGRVPRRCRRRTADPVPAGRQQLGERQHPGRRGPAAHRGAAGGPGRPGRDREHRRHVAPRPADGRDGCGRRLRPPWRRRRGRGDRRGRRRRGGNPAARGQRGREGVRRAHRARRRDDRAARPRTRRPSSPASPAAGWAGRRQGQGRAHPRRPRHAGHREPRGLQPDAGEPADGRAGQSARPEPAAAAARRARLGAVRTAAAPPRRLADRVRRAHLRAARRARPGPGRAGQPADFRAIRRPSTHTVASSATRSTTSR